MSDQPTVEIPRSAGQPVPPPRRRRRWIAVTAVIAALAVAAALSLYFALRSGSTPTASSSTSATPSPSQSAASVVLPSPNLSPSASPSTAAPSLSQPPAPDGRIALADLQNATLDIPPWPTDDLTGLSGPVKFTDNLVTVQPDAAFPMTRYMTISRAVYGDVNRDGVQETVAVINTVIQAGSEQVVAFTRDAANRIVTLGTVAATTGPVRYIDVGTLSIAPDGTISMKMADYQRCCGDTTPQQWQTRSYKWNGHGFTQSGGPTSFPVNPAVTETGLTADGLVLGPAIAGIRHGTLTVTVSYSYGATPTHLTLVFSPPAGLRPEGNQWPPIYTPPNSVGQFAVDLPTPARGTSKTYTFAFSRPANATGNSTLMLYVYGATNGANKSLAESNPFNNSLQLAVHTLG